MIVACPYATKASLQKKGYLKTLNICASKSGVFQKCFVHIMQECFYIIIFTIYTLQEKSFIDVVKSFNMYNLAVICSCEAADWTVLAVHLKKRLHIGRVLIK